MKGLENLLIRASVFTSIIVREGLVEIIQRVTEEAKLVVSHLCLLSFVVGIALYVFPDPTGPWPAPAPHEEDITQLPPTGRRSLGVVSTGTGPTAITLNSLSATSGGSLVAFTMVLGAVAIVGGGLFVARKRK